MSAQSENRAVCRDPDRKHVAGTMVELCFVVAVALLFNIYPQHVGVIANAADPETFSPLLGAGFAPYLAWLNVYWFWAFCLCLAHLVMERWTVVTRLLDLALDLFGAAIFAFMFAGHPFLGQPATLFFARVALFSLCLALLIGAADQLVQLLKLAWRAVRASGVTAAT